MKRLIKLFIVVMVLALVTACSSGNNKNPSDSGEGSDNPPGTEENKPPVTDDNDEDKEDSDKDGNDENNSSQPLTEEEVLADIQKELKTDLNIRLPESLSLKEGEYLTALTDGDNNSYTVTFFTSKEPMSLNNEQLTGDNNPAEKILKLEAKKYSSAKEAQDQIAFEDYTDQDFQPVDLGHGITGHQDAGAGSAFTSWNEGRWALTTRSLTSDSDKGVALAKDTVEYLEKNTLPIPKEYGTIHLDTEENGNLTNLQDGEIVYTFTEVKNPMDMLKILVSFKQ